MEMQPPEDEQSGVTGFCFTFSILDFVSTIICFGLHLSRNEAFNGHLRGSLQEIRRGGDDSVVAQGWHRENLHACGTRVEEVEGLKLYFTWHQWLRVLKEVINDILECNAASGYEKWVRLMEVSMVWGIN